jgi:putative drug exporter of the RND superfamily
MLKRLTPENLARASSRRPWLTIGVWILLVVAAGVASSQLLGNSLTQDANFTNKPESIRAKDLADARLHRSDHDTEFVIVRSSSATVDEPSFAVASTGIERRLSELGPRVVGSAASFYQTHDPSMVSRDRHAMLILVQMAGDLDRADDNIDKVLAAVDRGAPQGFEVLVAGQATLGQDLNSIAEKDLQKGESIGIMAALVVLLVVFGAVVAALLPVGIALIAIGVAVGLVALLGLFFDWSFFVTNMITMMGLAVAIDYCLFIVSRYREERAAGLPKEEAIAMAGSTASRAVLFSGMTVVLALMGMLIIPTTIFRSLAGGAILVVITAVAGSLTLLPAFLGLFGDRINRLRVFRHKARPERDETSGFWGRVAHGVMARPVLSIVVASSFLILAAASYVRLDTGFSGVSTLPDTVESKKAFTVLASQFSGGLTNPVEIVVDGKVATPRVKDGIEELRALLAADGEFGPTSVQVDAGGDLALVSAPVVGDPSSKAATASVDRIRQDYVPQALPEGTADQVLVGGDPAINKDFFDLTDQYQPIVLAFVLGLSFILLMMVFRSVVVPLKAIVLNLLSVGASYGLLALVFIKGGPGTGKWLADLFGFQQVEVVEAWLPLFLFSVLFGLSMDYHVFLLSRIRERFVQTQDNAGSVAYGLTRTGGIITGAALIMVAVFAGFAAGQMVMFQQMGFGLGVAVLIDATIIRSVLVPAAMKLLGGWNWYLPRWLEWLPHLSVEGPAARRLVTVPEPERIREPV